MGVPLNGWFIVENHLKMDDLMENPIQMGVSENVVYP